MLEVISEHIAMLLLVLEANTTDAKEQVNLNGKGSYRCRKRSWSTWPKASKERYQQGVKSSGGVTVGGERRPMAQPTKSIGPCTHGEHSAWIPDSKPSSMSWHLSTPWCSLQSISIWQQMNRAFLGLGFGAVICNVICTVSAKIFRIHINGVFELILCCHWWILSRYFKSNA